MDQGRHVGTATVAKYVGRASVEPQRKPAEARIAREMAVRTQSDRPSSAQLTGPEPSAPKLPAAGTSVMVAPPSPAPVFVDDSGWRRRRLRAIVFALAVLTVLATAAVWLSVTFAPVRPAPLHRCPSATTSASDCGRS